MNTDLDIAIDTYGQAGRFERQNSDDDNEIIDLTPSHRIPEMLASAVRESTPTTTTGEPQSSKQSHSPSTGPCPLAELESLSAGNQIEKPKNDGKPLQKWDTKEWDENEFDSDEENMSLAVMMKLANELSLLKSFLEIYRKFNIHLGGTQSFFTLTQPPLMHHMSH